jgi:hypothetical protein
MDAVHHRDATVGSQSDIDGTTRRVILCSNRTGQDPAWLWMTPNTARRIATQLRKHANLIDPPKRRTPAR